MREKLHRARKASESKVTWSPHDPVTWIEKEFYIPETGRAIQLEAYQKAVLQEAFRRDSDGKLIYSLILWSDLKKSAKSTIAAAVVLWMAWHHEWETCRVVGNDLKQASSRTFYYIERALKLNDRFKPHVKLTVNHIELDNHTRIDAIPVDPKGEAGGGDLVVCFTELWAAKNEASKQLWTETTLSPLKYGQSIRFCESYAGFTGASPILEQLYEQGVTQGRRVEVGIDGLELYANDAARLLCLWNTVPRCEWQTNDYYAQEAAVLTDSEYRRIHRNEWQADQESFVPDEWWSACKGNVPPPAPLKSIVVAMDAATDSDCFAIAAVYREGESVYVLHARIWTPPKGGKLEFNDVIDPHNPETPEGYVRWLCKTYNVAEVAYDPYQLHDMASRLSREGVAYFRPFPQGAPRLVADKGLYDLIRDRRIIHDGNHALSEHVRNANRKAEGDNLRIVKRKVDLKIDLCVATSMAAAEAKRLNIG